MRTGRHHNGGPVHFDERYLVSCLPDLVARWLAAIRSGVALRCPANPTTFLQETGPKRLGAPKQPKAAALRAAGSAAVQRAAARSVQPSRSRKRQALGTVRRSHLFYRPSRPGPRFSSAHYLLAEFDSMGPTLVSLLRSSCSTSGVSWPSTLGARPCHKSSRLASKLQPRKPCKETLSTGPS